MIPASASEARAPRVDEPFISSDLAFEAARLQASREYAVEGHAGRTLTKYPELRVVLEAMKAGTRLPFHETGEQLTLHVILGQLRVWLPFADNCDLFEGSFAASEAGRVHEVEALQDCAFVLTLAWPPMAEAGRAAVVTDDGADGTGY